MPDPTNPTQDQKTPVASSPSDVVPVISPQSDLPPLPPDFQSAGSGGPVSPTPPVAAQSITEPPIPATPSDVSPMITPSPKKKFGGGRIIATILGVLVLTGGIVGGVILTQQQQNIEEQARVEGGGGGLKNTLKKTSGGISGGAGSTSRDVSGGAESAGREISGGAGSAGGGIAGGAGSTGEGGSVQNYPPGTAGKLCQQLSKYESVPADCADQTTGSVGKLCQQLSKYGSTPAECDTSGGGGGGGGTTTTTITETTPTAQCQDIKAYKTDWTLLTAADLSNLTAGNQVNFCVRGTASENAFDMARFTINGTVQADTTLVRPGSTNEFCQNYTILAGISSFNITAQIHHLTLGWK